MVLLTVAPSTLAYRAQLYDAPYSKQPEIDINTGLLIGAHDAADTCQPECHQWIDLPGNGFANKTQQFIEGYIHGYCSNAKNAGGAGSESDTAGFDCDGGPKSAYWSVPQPPQSLAPTELIQNTTNLGSGNATNSTS